MEGASEMAKNGQETRCGICGKKWGEGMPKLTLYNLPVSVGDCYVIKPDRLCDECKELIQELTKKKMIEIGNWIESRRKQFIKARYE